MGELIRRRQHSIALADSHIVRTIALVHGLLGQLDAYPVRPGFAGGKGGQKKKGETRFNSLVGDNGGQEIKGVSLVHR